MDVTELVPKFGPIVGVGITFVLLGLGLIVYEINGKTKQVASLQGKLTAEEKVKIKEIVAKFDRKAIHVPMYEEDMMLMVRSLHDLNIDIRKLGINAIAVQEIRDLFKIIGNEIEEILYISLFIGEQSKNLKSDFVDLRSFGGLNSDFGPSYSDRKLKKKIEQSYADMFEFTRNKMKGDSTSAEVSHIYLFGRIDQLKREIDREIELVKELIDEE